MSLAAQLAERYVCKQAGLDKTADIKGELDAIEGRGPGSGLDVSQLVSSLGQSPIATGLGGAALGAGLGALGSRRRGREGSSVVDALMGAAAGGAIGFGVPHVMKAMGRFGKSNPGELTPEMEQELIEATKSVSPDRSIAQVVGDNLGGAGRWVFDPANPVTSVGGLGAAAGAGVLGRNVVNSGRRYNKLDLAGRRLEMLNRMDDNDLLGMLEKSLQGGATDSNHHKALNHLMSQARASGDTKLLRSLLANESAPDFNSVDMPEIRSERYVSTTDPKTKKIKNKLEMQNTVATPQEIQKLVSPQVLDRAKNITENKGWKGFIEGMTPGFSVGDRSVLFTSADAALKGPSIPKSYTLHTGKPNTTLLNRMARRPIPKLRGRNGAVALGLGGALALGGGEVEEALLKVLRGGNPIASNVPNVDRRALQEQIQKIMNGGK